MYVQIELVQFEMSWLTRAAQYRWFQVAYQLGVFISRSSIALVRLPYPWTFVILQVLISVSTNFGEYELSSIIFTVL